MLKYIFVKVFRFNLKKDNLCSSYQNTNLQVYKNICINIVIKISMKPENFHTFMFIDGTQKK